MQNKTTLSDCANLVSQNNIIYNNIKGGKNFTATVAVSDEMEIEDCAQGIGLMGHIRHIGLIKMRAGNAIEEVQKLDLAHCEARIKMLSRIEVMACVDKAIYLAHCYSQFSKGIAWLQWAKDITDNDDRMLYVLLKVGRMFLDLPPEFYYKHNHSDIYKLELIASLGSNDQKVMLSDERLGTMTRDELRAECARLNGKMSPAKKEVQEQGTFFKLLDGMASEELTQDDVYQYAEVVPVEKIFKSSCAVIGILKATVANKHLACYSQEDREAFANSLQALAFEIRNLK